MKSPMSPTPVLQFSLPPGGGVSVEEAAKALERAAGEYDAADAEYRAERARKNDWKQFSDPDGAVQEKARHAAKLSELEARRHALAVAVDEAGNALAAAIDADRAEWLDRLAPLEATAADRYAAAIEEAVEAFTALQAARGAAQWLERFDLDHAIVGQVLQFAGGRIRLKSRKGLNLNEDLDPAALLRLAGEASRRPEPEPVSVATGAEARFAHA